MWKDYHRFQISSTLGIVTWSHPVIFSCNYYRELRAAYLFTSPFRGALKPQTTTGRQKTWLRKLLCFGGGRWPRVGLVETAEG